MVVQEELSPPRITLNLNLERTNSPQKEIRADYTVSAKQTREISQKWVREQERLRHLPWEYHPQRRDLWQGGITKWPMCRLAAQGHGGGRLGESGSKSIQNIHKETHFQTLASSKQENCRTHSSIGETGEHHLLCSPSLHLEHRNQTLQPTIVHRYPVAPQNPGPYWKCRLPMGGPGMGSLSLGIPTVHTHYNYSPQPHSTFS